MRRPVYKPNVHVTHHFFFMVLFPREAGGGCPLSLGWTLPREGWVWVDVRVCGLFSGTRPDLSQGILRRSAVSYDA